MMPNDPFQHDRMEYWAERSDHHTRHGHSTGHLRAADKMWDIMESTVKILTFPIWWPIVQWNKRKKRMKRPVDPFATDINRRPYK